MDWLEEQWQKLYQKMTHMSLKKTLAAYIFLALLSVLSCWLVTWQICESWQRMLGGESGEGYQLIYIQMEDGTMGYARQTDEAIDVLPENVQGALKVVRIVQNFSIFLYTGVAIWLVAWLYYRNKLRHPIALLTCEAEHIGHDDLDFSCAFHSDDEMGSLCNAVEGMRKKLAARQGKIWEEMEEQRRLNAAFAHDLRTPLTVLQGYVDLLETYYPQGRISQEKMEEILGMMDGQLDRLRRFGDTMKKIHSLEERGAVLADGKLEELSRHLAETARVLSSAEGPEIVFRMTGEMDGKRRMDLELIQEVADNLISNALRYACRQVELILEAETDTLRLSVRDDGRGFSREELKMAAQPYYTDQKEQGQHFGIGLYISRMLCQKHGGSLTLSNSVRGGAVVCAQFHIG